MDSRITTITCNDTLRRITHDQLSVRIVRRSGRARRRSRRSSHALRRFWSGRRHSRSRVRGRDILVVDRPAEAMRDRILPPAASARSHTATKRMRQSALRYQRPGRPSRPAAVPASRAASSRSPGPPVANGSAVRCSHRASPTGRRRSDGSRQTRTVTARPP